MEELEVDGGSPDDSFIVDLDGLEKSRAEEKFKLLQDMFPDAETMFLQAKCAELAFDNVGFDVFLEETMLRELYPKKSTTPPAEAESVPQDFGSDFNFNLDAFLKKYSDPKKYFNNYAGGVHYVQFSYYYLLNRHKLHSATVIRNYLHQNGCNLTVAHNILRNARPSRKIPRRESEMKPPTGVPPLEFYDEVTFVENQFKIEQYFLDKVIAHNNAVEEARAAQALLTCGCCYSDDLLAEEVSTCSEGHIFCKTCILRSTQVLMGNGKLDFPCLEECSGSFSLETLKVILPPNAFEKLSKKLQEREIATANIPGLETCAFCEYSAIPPDEARIFDCENCKKQMCRSCRKESHIPFRCEEVTERNELLKERLFVEEKMTDALLRTCWRCNAKFIREDGCNKMVCICGAKMCYICRQPIKDYGHFAEDVLSNPGSKCPLWTNNEHLHRHEVNREGRRAIEVLKRKNPELENLLYKKKR